jgi:hypothetical protein
MSSTVDELLEQAMSLPAEARARLADLLVESLDTDVPGPIGHVWLREAKRRRDELRNGQVRSIPGEQALREVRDALRQ